MVNKAINSSIKTINNRSENQEIMENQDLMFKIMKSGFSCTNLKRNKSITPLNLFLIIILLHILPPNRHNNYYKFSYDFPMISHWEGSGKGSVKSLGGF